MVHKDQVFELPQRRAAAPPAADTPAAAPWPPPAGAAPRTRWTVLALKTSFAGRARASDLDLSWHLDRPAPGAEPCVRRGAALRRHRGSVGSVGAVGPDSRSATCKAQSSGPLGQAVAGEQRQGLEPLGGSSQGTQCPVEFDDLGTDQEPVPEALENMVDEPSAAIQEAALDGIAYTENNRAARARTAAGYRGPPSAAACSTPAREVSVRRQVRVSSSAELHVAGNRWPRG